MQLDGESVGYAKPIAAVSDLFNKRGEKKKHKSKSDKFEIFEENNSNQDKENGKQKKKKHTTKVHDDSKNLMSPPSRRVSSQELNYLWTQSAKKNSEQQYSSRLNAKR